MRETGWAFETLHRLQARVEVVETAQVPRLHGAATPAEIARMLSTALEGEAGEVLGAVLLDRGDQVQGWTWAPVRVVEGVRVEIRAVLQVALLTMAEGLIGFRWAPGGRRTAQAGDRRLAARLVQGAGVLDLEVRDYLVVDAEGGWTSLRETWSEWPQVVELGLLWPPQQRRQMPVKYRDPTTGETWHGGGDLPNWLKARLESGFEKDDFAVTDQ